jgi:hypothetical protein
MNERSQNQGRLSVDRRELAGRWKVSIETLKRRERTKILRPMRLDGRIVCYRMSDVVRIEQEGFGD